MLITFFATRTVFARSLDTCLSREFTSCAETVTCLFGFYVVWERKVIWEGTVNFSLSGLGLGLGSRFGFRLVIIVIISLRVPLYLNIISAVVPNRVRGGARGGYSCYTANTAVVPSWRVYSIRVVSSWRGSGFFLLRGQRGLCPQLSGLIPQHSSRDLSHR